MGSVPPRTSYFCRHCSLQAHGCWHSPCRSSLTLRRIGAQACPLTLCMERCPACGEHKCVRDVSRAKRGGFSGQTGGFCPHERSLAGRVPGADDGWTPRKICFEIPIRRRCCCVLPPGAGGAAGAASGQRPPTGGARMPQGCFHGCASEGPAIKWRLFHLSV
jgi:hypothetical protein